jgi:hypothetical protein
MVNLFIYSNNRTDTEFFQTKRAKIVHNFSKAAHETIQYISSTILK